MPKQIKKEEENLNHGEQKFKDIETNTDFPYPDIPLRKYKFKINEDSPKYLVPTSLTPILPCYTNSNPKIRQSLSPLLPHSFQNYSIKSISPITLITDFEIGRTRSSSKDTLKVHIHKMKTLITPKAKSRKLRIREKFKNIHLRSVLNNINS